MTTNVNLGFVAAAGGTVDAITATYSPAPTALVDKMLLWFRATGANTSTTPTFSPNGLTARTIVKNGGTALVAGDIPAANAIMEVVYDATNTRWELLNPRYEAFVRSYTTAQISALTGMTLRQRVFNTTDNDYEWYDGTRWVKEAHPKYKVYKAVFFDDGAIPTATVRENNLGTVTWASDLAGNITVTATGLLTVGKTSIIYSANYGTIGPDVATSYIYDGLGSVNGFQIKSYNISTGTPSGEALISGAYIEIQVEY